MSYTYGLIVTGVILILGIISRLVLSKTKHVYSVSATLNQLLIISIVYRIVAFFAVWKLGFYFDSYSLLLIPSLIAALLSPFFAIGIAKAVRKH
jgi:hypothetical protein